MKNPEYQVKTDIFSIADGEWKVRINGEVLTPTWNSKGAALAGLRTECWRMGIHELSSSCWCSPQRVDPNK